MFSTLKSRSDVKAVVKANNSFSAELLQKLDATDSGNLVYSPISLSSVLAMTYLGAEGNTKEELRKGLNFPEDPGTFEKGYQKLLTSLVGNHIGYKLCFSNRFYVNSSYKILPKYEEAMKRYFLDAFEQLDLGNIDNEIENINSWVGKTTNGKITNVVSPETFNEEMRIFVLIAIYFKGYWKKPFSKEMTLKMPFYRKNREGQVSTEVVYVNMMHKLEKLPYVLLEECDAHAVKLDYKGGRVCMIIIAPLNVNSDVNKIEEALGILTPKILFAGMSERSKVDLYLPKFKIENTLQIVPILKSMGMADMFDPLVANFSKMSANPGLFVSNVVQKAFVEVNEKGTEAAAVTYESMGSRGRKVKMPSIIPFAADSPFIFQIVDCSTNLVLFCGRLGRLEDPPNVGSRGSGHLECSMVYRKCEKCKKTFWAYADNQHCPECTRILQA